MIWLKAAKNDVSSNQGLNVPLIADQTHNHFTLVNELADTESPLFKRVMAMIHAQNRAVFSPSH